MCNIASIIGPQAIGEERLARTQCDTKVVIAAYHDWSRGCLNRFHDGSPRKSSSIWRRFSDGCR